MAIGVGFRVLQTAFEELYGDEIPNRKDISIFSGHGGPGFRDVFEFVPVRKREGSTRSIRLIQKASTTRTVLCPIAM